MREQIERLIEELEAKARQHETNGGVMGFGKDAEALREYSKATATYHCIKRMWELLADSPPVSGEIDTVDRV